ncbi:MAG: hypothetical protein ABW170_23060 [Candidatus Thiodiazotropha sp. L084R]
MKTKFVLPVILLVSACGGGGDNSDNADRELNILGGWLSPCMANSFSGGDSSSSEEVILETVGYGTTTLMFDNNDQLTAESINYTDETCAFQESEAETFIFTYVLGDLVITDSGLEAQQIDIIYDNAKDGSTVYGIIRPEGRLLYLSDFEEEQRPSNLNLSEPFTKL